MKIPVHYIERKHIRGFKSPSYTKDIVIYEIDGEYTIEPTGFIENALGSKEIPPQWVFELSKKLLEGKL